MFTSKMQSVLVIALAAMACLFGLMWGVSLPILGMALLLPLAVAASNPPMFLSLVLMVAYSGLRAPMLPGTLTFYHVLAIPFVGLSVLGRCIHTNAPRTPSLVQKPVLLFGLIVAATAIFRGAGFRMFGGNLWGGSLYVDVLVTCSLCLASGVVTLPVSGWRRILIAMSVLSLLPSLAEFLDVISGGAVTQQYAFIRSSRLWTQEAISALSGGYGIARLRTGFGAFLIGLPFVLSRRPFQGATALISMGYILMGFTLAGLSGSRASILDNVVTLVFIGALAGNRFRLSRALWLCAIFGIALGIVALILPVFPLNIQRALSFMPFAQLDAFVRENAIGTVTWRVDLWQRALHDLPRYWLLGKGFGFDPIPVFNAMRLGHYHEDWAYLTGTYHNGPLSLILLFGVPGFIAGMAIPLLGVMRYYRAYTQTIIDTERHRIFRVVLAIFFAQVFMFLTIAGDIQNSFGDFFLLIVLLNGLSHARGADETPPPA